MNLPYHHDLMLRVTVVNDGPTGEHGYITTAARLATLIGGLDEHVVGVSALPDDVDYRGKTDQPDPPRALGYLDNQAGAEAWRRGR